MALPPGCAAVYDNAREKEECARNQLYQLMICDDANGLAGGFVMSGWDDRERCRKGCGDLRLCEDGRSAWFRADTGREEAAGPAVLGENGWGVVPGREGQ